MPIKTEKVRPGEFVLSEGNGGISYDPIIMTGAAFVAGQVLGMVANGTASAVADAGNTGDGAMGAITVLTGAKQGDYTLTFIEPGANVGDFIVEDPDGQNVGSGAVAAAFSAGGLGFTLADGAADFVAGDQFVITVAAGSGKYVAHDPAAADGSEVAAAVLYGAVDASAADDKGVAVARLAEVDGSQLTWKTAISADDKTAGINALATQNLIVR
jgi:phage tail sheath protein FI